MSDTKKVVINRCYGGFSLSPHAVQRLAELQGRDCYFFVNDQTNDRIDFNRYVRVTVDEAAAAFMFTAFDTPEPPKSLSGEAWAAASQEERIASNEEYSRHQIDSRPDDRADPLLVQVVEELGEKANGAHASLKVVEIPADIEYTIDEYDGIESIDEAHRTWS